MQILKIIVTIFVLPISALITTSLNLRREKSRTKLNVDIFGLGAAEVVVIAGAFVLLYGCYQTILYKCNVCVLKASYFYQLKFI